MLMLPVGDFFAADNLPVCDYFMADRFTLILTLANQNLFKYTSQCDFESSDAAATCGNLRRKIS